MHLPGPVRAAVGLVASAADEAKRLPDRALELPMLAVSTALQASVRAQQRYARLTARGDELLNRTRPTDEPPEWAQFDEPVAVAQVAADASADAAPVEKSGALKPTARKSPARKTTARTVNKSTARKSTARKSTTAQPAVESAPAEQPAPANGKAVNKPRHTAPSRFDDAADD